MTSPTLLSSRVLSSLTGWRKSAQKIKSPLRKSRARGNKLDESWLDEESSDIDSSNCDTLEIVSPSLSDLQFKYNWNINNFVDKVKSNSAGLNSKPFTISASGLVTTWNLSVRCWYCQGGVRLHNPVVICLNLIHSSSDGQDTSGEVSVHFQFGVFNHDMGHYTMGKIDQASVGRGRNKLQSVGYQNIFIAESNGDSRGNVRLGVRLSLGRQEDDLESDLAALIDDEVSSDMVLACKNRTFKVHRNILSARSSVIGKLLEEKEERDSKHSVTSESYNVTDDESEEPRKESEAEADLNSDDEQDSSSGGGSLDNFCDTTTTRTRKPRLSMLEVDDKVASKFLVYIYTGRFEMTDHPTVQSLLILSDNYQVLGLKKRCEFSLMETINTSNVATYLYLGHIHSCSRLKLSALKFCRDNHQTMIKDVQWKKIESEFPFLYFEAISVLDTPELCSDHQKCIEKSGTRYKTERKARKSTKK